ncbi:alpha/beta hydrolase [Streptomyces sp. NPDC005408]|uniref:alpha/beta fold hydrolase n=1 Tax=Streptomyces sp. NPDC005408 TaxID=3155341 RepID=UPI0033AEBF21
MHPTALLLRTALNATSYVAPRLAGRMAFAAFVRPLGRSRPRPSEGELLATARTARLAVNGKSVVTYAWGDGDRPVLLVHGWSSRSSRFADFITALRDKGYSPVTFDAPGHGDSTGRASTILEYREIIRQLHAQHGDFDAVVAHSFGVLASFFALRGEVTAGRIVGIGGVAEFDYLLDEFRDGLRLRDRVMRELRVHIENLPFADEPGIGRLFSATYRPEEVAIPVLLFHDEADEMVPPAQSRAIAAAHGERARLVVTRGLGHRRILGDPEVVAEAVDFAVSGRNEVPAASAVREGRA